MSPRRQVEGSTDASKLSFPLQLVIVILSATGAIWATQYGLRSDVRDIRTRMELQAQVDAERMKVQEERAAQMKSTIESMQRRQELQGYELQALKESILKLGVKP